jgi:hypothetical protein
MYRFFLVQDFHNHGLDFSLGGQASLLAGTLIHHIFHAGQCRQVFGAGFFQPLDDLGDQFLHQFTVANAHRLGIREDNPRHLRTVDGIRAFVCIIISHN